jgi:Zn-dependent M28 family amino/carboxypeptidase
MPNNPFLTIDQRIMGDIYTSPEAMDNLAVLCDEFGSRFGGTEGERKAAEFMLGKLTSYGLSNVHLEPLDYVGWRRGEVNLEIVSPISKRIDCITLPHSPPADLIGEIVDLGDGVPDDFDRRANEIEGRIVLTTSEVNPAGVKRWIHRGEKYGRSLMAGAKGFIFVNHYPGYGPATGGIGRNGEAPIPGISVSYEDGSFIQRLLKRSGKVAIRLSSSDMCEPMVSWNVIGDLPGSDNPSKLVMLGCHYDGHDISQGAADPASGAVAVLEAARVLAKHGGELPRTLRFLLWGVEEIGLLGSKEYVNAHADELDNILFYLNMDSAGAISDKGLVLNEWPELEPVLGRWSEEMSLEFGVEQSVSAHSDHFPFMMAGVPTGGVGKVGGTKRGGRGYGHTRYDTLDKVTLTGLREAAALASRLLLRIATSDGWPAGRRDQDSVAAVLDGPDYNEEAAYRTRIETFYSNLQAD